MTATTTQITKTSIPRPSFIESGCRLLRACFGVLAATFAFLTPPLVSAEQLATEELLVTAQSREQESLNLHSALNSLNKEALQQANIAHTRDLVKLAPALTTLQSFNNRQSAFLIRGLGTLIFSTGVEPSVITMVDGVSLGSAAQSMMPLLDVSRVDVWRGPQVTRFGRNAAAGVVNLISARAGEKSAGQLHVTANSAEEFDSQQVTTSAFYGGPLTNNLRARFGLTVGDTEGYLDNVFDNEALNNEHSKAFTAKFDWNASDSIAIAFDARYGESSGDCCAPVVTSVLSAQISNALQPVLARYDNRTSNTNTRFVNNSRSSSARLNMVWSFNSGFTLQANSAYSRYSEREAQDFDFLPIDIIPLSAGYDTHRQFSQHVALFSPDDRAISYSAGAYFERQRRSRLYERGILNIASAALDASIEKNHAAAFANLQFQLNSRHTLRGGLRYADNELSYLANREAFPLQGLMALNNVSDADNSQALDAEASWQYNPSSTRTVYARWSRGHKAPAYNIIFDLDANALEPVRKERGTSWELAYRHVFPAQQVMLNATAYHSRFNDYQAQVQEPGSVKFLLLNSGSIRSYGIELDARWQYKRWQVQAAFDWMSARIGAVSGVLCGNGEIVRGECPNGFRELNGEPLPFAPDHKLNLALRYSLPTQLFGMSISADSLFRWQSSMQTSFNNDPLRQQGTFGIWNLGVSAQGESLRARLYVDNVLNKQFALAHFDNPIDAGGYVSFFARESSRIIGLSLSYSF